MGFDPGQDACGWAKGGIRQRALGGSQGKASSHQGACQLGGVQHQPVVEMPLHNPAQPGSTLEAPLPALPGQPCTHLRGTYSCRTSRIST